MKYLQVGIIILFNPLVVGVVRFGCGSPELMVKYQVLLSRVYRIIMKKIFISFLCGVILTSCVAYILMARLLFSFTQEQALITLSKLSLNENGHKETLIQKRLSANYAIEQVKNLTKDPFIFCDENTLNIIAKAKVLKLNQDLIPSCL
jgi:hypothetical protein